MRDGQESTAGWGVGRSPNVKRDICVVPVTSGTPKTVAVGTHT